LGELPQNQACQSFRPRGQTTKLPIAPTEVQLSPEKPIDFEWAAEFKRIYGEQLQIERDLYEATKEIQFEFFQNQAPAELDRGFERDAQRLADLRRLHVLCGLFECDVYRDAIMAAEIEHLFGQSRPDMVQSIQKAVKEFANAGILRASNDAKRTAMDSTTGGRSERKTRNRSVQAVDTAPRTNEKPRRS
jgi:hypothetical protein